MWIRSQDRERLYDCNRFMIDERQEYNPGDCRVVSTGKYNVMVIFCGEYEHEDTDILGTYESKERALEVLDEIQQAIADLKTYEMSPAVVDGAYWANVFTIYQMPEK